MTELQRLHEFLSELEGLVTIQHMKDGRWLFAVSRNDATVAAIRGTFLEAATECLANLNASRKPNGATRNLTTAR